MIYPSLGGHEKMFAGPHHVSWGEHLSAQHSSGVAAGLHAMMALRAGACHVTAVDRWLYMALACKESLVSLSESCLQLLTPPDTHVLQLDCLSDQGQSVQYVGQVQAQPVRLAMGTNSARS